MNIKELLPIGSIVLLKDGEKKLMVYGVKQSDEGDNNKEHDYIGVMYPEGNIGSEYQFLFNHEDIVEVAFRGFENSEREAFIEELEKCYK